MAGPEQLQPQTGEYVHKVDGILRNPPYRYLERILKPRDIPAICSSLIEGYKEVIQGQSLEDSDYNAMPEDHRMASDRRAANIVIRREGLIGIAALLDPDKRRKYIDELEESFRHDEESRRFLRRKKLELAKLEPYMVVVEGWSESTKHYALWNGLSAEKARLEGRKAEVFFSDAEMSQASEIDLNLINQGIDQCTKLQSMLEARK